VVRKGVPSRVEGGRWTWFYGSVNNRKIATLIWLGLALAVALTKQEIRAALWECVKAFA
jgi:hypothetical protein